MINVNVKKISSFEVDHNTLTEGFYISRIDHDVCTYDLRTRKPNAGDYMDNRTMHSVEHMLATYIRNSEIGDKIIYFGPMGCQTGFYLLVKNLEHQTVFNVLKNTLRKIINHSGDIFGGSAKECGNYKNLSIDDAKKECSRYLKILENIKSHNFTY